MERDAEWVISELRKFLPEWGHPSHVIAAICLEIKARATESGPTGR